MIEIVPRDGDYFAVVRPEDTAAAIDPSLPRVASTPFLLALVELACHVAMASKLADGEISVGVGATITHLLPSVVGRVLRVTVTWSDPTSTPSDFDAEVWDGSALVAQARHQRVAVRGDRIERRAERIAAESPV